MGLFPQLIVKGSSLKAMRDAVSRIQLRLQLVAVPVPDHPPEQPKEDRFHDPEPVRAVLGDVQKLLK